MGRGELHHVVHPQQAEEVLSILFCRLQVAHKVVLNLARVAKPVHLPPVLIEGHALLCLRVQEVLDEVGEGGVDAHGERLVHGGRRCGLVGIATQHDLCKAPVKIVVAQLKFIPVGGDEAHKRVPHKKKLGVLLQLHL